MDKQKVHEQMIKMEAFNEGYKAALVWMVANFPQEVTKPQPPEQPEAA